jgi:hypothetical protein
MGMGEFLFGRRLGKMASNDMPSKKMLAKGIL